ncbi:MAG: septum formation initiator family protein [Oscillibacter sp.]
MASKAKKAKQVTPIRVSLFTKILLLVLLAGIGWQFYRLQGQVEEANAQKTQLAMQVERQRQENDALSESIKGGGNQEQMEKIARDELGLVGPGEKVFYDVSN